MKQRIFSFGEFKFIQEDPKIIKEIVGKTIDLNQKLKSVRNIVKRLMFTLLSLFLILASFSCNNTKIDEESGQLSMLKNYKAIPSEFLNGASIAFIDSNGKNITARTFAELELTRQGFLLVPDSLFVGPKDAKEYVLQNEKSFNVSPNDTLFHCPKCALTRIWDNLQLETISVPCVFTFYNPYQTARLLPELNKLGVKQAFKINLPNSAKELTFYSCTITVKGTISCYKPCCSAEVCLFKCVFGDFEIHHGGTGEFTEFFIPCGINNCDGTPPGDGRDPTFLF